MKTILIPNDLSREAENALRYAVDFAMSLPERTELVVVHVFDSPMRDPRHNIELVTTDSLKSEHEVITRLNQQLDKLTKGLNLATRLYCTRGPVDEQIARFAQNQNATYIFMGTKGAQGLKAALQGSNTASVVELAQCPVLAIPETAVFSPLTNIVFASDFNDSDITYINQTIELGKHFNARIILLHLSQPGMQAQDTEVLAWVKDLVQSQNSYQRIDIANTEAANFTEAMDRELNKLKAGLLVMAPRKHSFFQNLLGRSNTRNMLHQAILPVLAMPAANVAIDALSSSAAGLVEEVNLN